MGLFSNRNAQQNVSERQLLESKYAGARHNLLILLAFTVINIILLLADGDTYFLFTGYAPYYLFARGYYLGETVNMVLSIAILALLLVCWLQAKKDVRWLYVGVGLVIADTLFLLVELGFDVDMIVDYVFHAYIIFSTARGILAHMKLKKLPPEQGVVADVEPSTPYDV